MKDTQIHTPEFNRLVAGFERELMKEGKDEIFISYNKIKLMEFLSYLEIAGITAIKGVNQSIAEGYMLYMKQERVNQNDGGTLDSGTIKLHRNAIHKFWKYLAIEGIKANSIWISQKRTTNYEKITVLTHQEIQQLYSILSPTGIGYRDRAMIAIHYGCGLRKGEGERLLVTDIDLNRSRIHVRKTKNNHERYVMMSPKVKQQVEEYLHYYRDLFQEKLNGSDVFFITETGTPIKCKLTNRLKWLWDRVKEKYNIDKQINLHALRHSLGTHLYMAGMEIETIALMLGHKRISTTQVYIHLSNQLKNGTI